MFCFRLWSGRPTDLTDRSINPTPPAGSFFSIIWSYMIGGDAQTAALLATDYSTPYRRLPFTFILRFFKWLTAIMSLNTQYMDMIWLKFYGLSRVNVLDYFYSSPFFDLTSNNQLIRTQGVRPEHLVTMVGLEYVLDEINISEPNLFVIRMQYRKSPREVSPREIFYCIDGVIYQSPDMLDLVRSRVTKASYYLGNSFTQLHATVSYSSIKGHRCWSDPVIDTEAMITGSAKDNLSGNEDTSGNSSERKTETATTFYVRDFPNFSRLVEDIESSF